MSIDVSINLKKGDFELDVKFLVRENKVICIYGPSGSGKTSLLRAIAGLDRPSKGHVLVNGTCWQSDDVWVEPHRRQVGYVFQGANLFPFLNVEGNLKFSSKRKRTKNSGSIDFGDIVGLLGLQSLLYRTVDGLSGGEQQRVAIARCLLSNPKLLLLDEPLTGLDNKSKHELLPYLESVQKELSIPMMYVSHSADEVSYLAQHIVLIERGQVISSGELNSVLTEVSRFGASREEDSNNDVFSVLEGEVTEHLSEYQLTSVTIDGQLFRVPGIQKNIGKKIRFRIYANDVSLCTEVPHGSSILNIIAVKVLALSEPNDFGQQLIQLNFGGQRLLARISMYSSQQLNLSVGTEMYAQIKAMALAT